MNNSIFCTYSSTQIEILRAIYNSKNISRNELAEQLGVSNLTIINNIKKLLDDGVIMESGTLPSEKGRKVSLLSINPDFCYFIAVDIGAYSTKLAVISLDGSILFQNQIIRTDQKVYEIYITPDILRNEISQLLDKYGRDRIYALCFCISGIVDFSTKTVRYSANIIGWNGVNFDTEFGNYFDLPVYLDSSGHCFALAERQFGHGRGISSMTAVSIGRSICTGIIINNHLIRGASGSAGELGHISVLDNPYSKDYTKWLSCTCGHEGCLEMFVTLPMIRYAVIQKMEAVKSIHYQPGSWEAKNIYTISWLKKKYENKVPYVVETVTKAAHILGTELAKTVNLLNPQLLVLSGGTISVFPDIVGIVEKDIKEKSLSIISNDLQVKSSALGADGPILGAALLAINDLFLE